MEQIPDSQAPGEARMRNPCKMPNYFLSAKRRCQVLPVPCQCGLGAAERSQEFWAGAFATAGGASRAPWLLLPVHRGGFVAESGLIPIYSSDLVFKETFLHLIMRKAERICRAAIDHGWLNTRSPITSQIARAARRQRQIMIRDGLRRWMAGSSENSINSSSEPSDPSLPSVSSAAPLGL